MAVYAMNAAMRIRPLMVGQLRWSSPRQRQSRRLITRGLYTNADAAKKQDPFGLLVGAGADFDLLSNSLTFDLPGAFMGSYDHGYQGSVQTKSKRLRLLISCTLLLLLF